MPKISLAFFGENVFFTAPFIFVLKNSKSCDKIPKKELRKIDWLNIEINEKIFKRLLIVGIIIILGYLLMTFLSFAVPRIYHMDKNTTLDTENTVKNGINHLYRGSLRLELSGWAYKEGQAVQSFKNSFVLKNKETEKMYLIKAGMKIMPELQFVDGYECLKCGMESQSIILGLKNGAYDLYILYQNDNENLLVDTGVQVDL